ncbi:MAG: 2OG-Fe(II) oxygenase [Alphaproteobacteria bacterium]
MVKIRLLLSGDHVYETVCADDAPLIGSLSRAMAGGNDPVELDILEDGALRGVCIPAARIVSVETEPPLRFASRQPPGQILPAAYIRIPGFLTPEENRAVMDYAIRKEPDFQTSGVDGDVKDHRQSRVLMALGDIDVAFEARVRELLPDVASHFGLALPDGYTFEMQMTAHANGGYFKIHNDNGSPRTASRFLTYVYYFCREPQAFSGGAMRMYDRSYVQEGNWVPIASYSEFAPANNMIIFFPSGQYHEVLPTFGADTFADGRFTLNGWIRPKN